MPRLIAPSSWFPLTGTCLLFALSAVGFEETPGNARLPKSEEELRYWLENMVHHHGFTNEEVREATGLEQEKLEQKLSEWEIQPKKSKTTKPEEVPLVLPYPGGRHPRIGFLEGAIDPQRETKFSVFAPWDSRSYVVVDLPEAVWSNLGLTYLAHTHVQTIWEKQGLSLDKQEWERLDQGVLKSHRKLPNGIEFWAEVRPVEGGVRMKLGLKNGTKELLSDLRVQICSMLKGAPGFTAQTNENKIIKSPYVIARSEEGTRFVITAWDPIHRPWANEKCPCLHADPKFPDCPPGETKEMLGWISFYEGKDLDQELERIEKLGWNREEKKE